MMVQGGEYIQVYLLEYIVSYSLCQWAISGKIGAMYVLKVRQIAESKHIGIAKLSRLADVSIISVRKMWRNPDYKPGLDTLEKVAKALEVRVEDLLEYIPDD